MPSAIYQRTRIPKDWHVYLKKYMLTDSVIHLKFLITKTYILRNKWKHIYIYSNKTHYEILLEFLHICWDFAPLHTWKKQKL